jgi:glutamate-ammonia-ligase adenylyltransferase
MGLPQTFSRLLWTDAARAETNLGLLRASLPEELFSLLPTILGQVPDPDTALNNLERFIPSAGQRVLDGLQRTPVLLHYLLAFFSYSRYLTETLVRQPELILWIEREKFLTRLKSREDLLEGLARFEATALDSDPALTLARFKRREYLRIALKDILRLADLTEITLELSVLSDVLVEKALRNAGKELERRFGWPHTTDAQGRPVRARFSVVSLGKLGGNELNYSSDIDLLFLYDGEGITPGGEAGEELAASEFFLRLGQRILQSIAGLTPEGAVFRVDMRLRPGGGEGDLVISLPAALAYYREGAREWELQMLLKARATAGNELLVREFVQAVESALYRDEMHFDVVESVLNSREQMDQKLETRRDARVDVKLSPGGIRDIEFLVQCLQRLHGRNDRWVRSRGTMLGLQRLTDKGYLAPRDHHALASAYQFLRLVEHRLQLDQGQQTHQVPEDRAALELLAHRCQLNPRLLGEEGSPSITEDFSQQLQAHRDAVQEIYARVLPRTRQSMEAEPFRLVPVPDVPAPQGMEFAPLLGELRKRSEALYQNTLELVIPGPARKLFHRFLAAVLAAPNELEALEQVPEVLPRVVELLVRSEPFGDQLIRHPEQVHQLLAVRLNEEGPALPFPGETEGTGRGMPFGAAGGASLLEKMALLRRGVQRRVFRWGVDSLWSTKPVEGSLREYSALAVQAVREAWGIAASEVEQEACEVTPVALGRLGMQELDYGADLDLVFVAANQDARLSARPLVEKFIHVLSAYTQEGTLFQVDSRLRPEGKEGELVVTAEGASEYFRNRAQTWEAAAYLKAVPVLGDDLGRKWRTKLQEILAERFSAWEEICPSLLAMRQRLEIEATAAKGEDNFKTGAGGLYDLDFILSGLTLRSGDGDIGGLGLEERVEHLRSRSVFDMEEDSETLQRAALFYRTVDHAIRLSTGQSSCVLPAGLRTPVVARLVGQWLGEDLTPPTLEARLAETRQAVRKVFNRVFEA